MPAGTFLPLPSVPSHLTLCLPAGNSRSTTVVTFRPATLYMSRRALDCAGRSKASAVPPLNGFGLFCLRANVCGAVSSSTPVLSSETNRPNAVSYTHLTLPTN